MTVTTDLRESVLQRIDLIAHAQQYTTLSNAGREWKGRCPLPEHQEKTASFYVNPDKRLWHCHGCKKGGNAIDLTMHCERLEFVVALELLCNRLGIEYVKVRGARGGGRSKLQQFNIMEAAHKVFRHNLSSPAGEAARTYLKGRRINMHTIERYGLGYAAREWDNLANVLLRAGAKAADCQELGLLGVRKERGGHYDFFRHRLMFPLRGVTGSILGYTGRALSDEDQPKYLNVSNSPLFNKSQYLYNLDVAKAHAQQGIVLVEGQFDVIAVGQLGEDNLVAPSGTALTEEHCAILLKYTDELYFCFDPDKAGQRATWDGGKLALKAGFSPKVMSMPAGMDPGELSLADDALAVWSNAQATARPLLIWWVDYQYRQRGRMSPVELRKVLAALKPIFNELPDELAKADFMAALADRTRINPDELRAILEDGQRGRRTAVGRPQFSGPPALEREIMRRLLADEAFRLPYLCLAEPSWFEFPLFAEIFSSLRKGVSASRIMAERSEDIALLLAGEASEASYESLLTQQYDRHLRRLTNA